MAQAAQGKGEALAQLKRYEEALAAYQQAGGLDPTNSSAAESKNDLNWPSWQLT